MAGIRQCTMCKAHKLPDEFHRRASRCKPCAREATKQWRSSNPERVQHYTEVYRGRYAGSKSNGYRLKYRYGISLEDHKAMSDRQGGKCAICTKPFDKTPHVDHCHSTGKIRGLLCDTCNRGIGYFKEDAGTLSAAAEYLRANT